MKQDKQVQVDLQDLGYETCGRSENEAERERAPALSGEEAWSVGLALPHKGSLHIWVLLANPTSDEEEQG